jgi:hypothetical protein
MSSASHKRHVLVSTGVAALAAVAAAAAVALAGEATAPTAQAPQSGVITACQKTKGAAKGRLRVVRANARCRRGEKKLTWSAVGETGPKGDKGDKGDTGTPDPSAFYTKAESDGRYLGAAAKAADAELLDGLDGSAFMQGAGRVRSMTGDINVANLLVEGNVQLGALCFAGTQAQLRITNLGSSPIRFVDHVAGQTGEIGGFNFHTLVQGPGLSRAHVQVSAGAAFELVTTFTAAINNSGSCPARWWAQAVTAAI